MPPPRDSFCLLLCMLSIQAGLAVFWPQTAAAEWYVAGQVGPTFADKLADIEGTRFLLNAPDFDLKNSIAYGAKLGYFGQHGWFGLEGEVFNTTPHIKSLGPDPGIHLRVTTLALNFIARYPCLRVQPYAGIGFGLLFSRLDRAPGTQSDSDVSSGMNLLTGIRFFVSPYVSMFTEYKYQQATFVFDNAFGANGGFLGDYRAQHLMVGMAYHF
jgi:opacity protein-like surface antigen